MNQLREEIQEIILTLGRNKLRTLLTGFAVAWGVLLLILLLGVSTGIRGGILYNIGVNGTTDKSISLYLLGTSKPYKGYPEGRSLHSSVKEVRQILQGIHGIENIHPQVGFFLPIATPENEQSEFVRGIQGSFKQEIESLKMLYGRHINHADNAQRKKVIVITDLLAKKLFGKENVIGQRVELLYSFYTIVGVYKSSGAREAFAPYETFARQFPAEEQNIYKIDLYCPTIKTDKEISDLNHAIKQRVALLKDCDPTDKELIYLDAQVQTNRQVERVMLALQIFMWIMGISTLIIGIVGVANIMLVTVSERMSEIGIRKALGARPWDIVRMVVSESIIVTLISGLIGLIVAVIILGILQYVLETTGMAYKTIEEFTFVLFKDPVISPAIGFGSVLLMIISGALAGFFPAKRAVRIPAIEAMKN